MTKHTHMRLGVMLRAAFQNELRHRLGLSFSQNRAAALDDGVHRAAARMTGGSLGVLLYRLRHGDPAVMTTLIDELTVGETYFFREPDQFEFLRRIMLAARAGAHPGRLRLWSAGCASGEEPYTMAILAMGILGTRASEMVEIVATDVHPGALARARQGLYRPWSFRGVMPVHRARWFTKEGERWRVCEQVRSLVTFAPLNLMDTASTRWPRDMDLVFCRNVLMYLDAAAIDHICAGLRRAMVAGGWLITAPCDPLVGAPGLRVDTSLGFLAYRAISAARDATCLRSAMPAHAAARSRSTGDQIDPAERIGDASGTSTAAAGSLPSYPSTAGTLHAATSLDSLDSMTPGAAAPAASSLADNDTSENAEVVGTEDPDIVAGPFSEALRLANEGNIAAALRLANSLLTIAPAHPAAYVLRATLYQSMNDHQGVVRDVQRALLLDRSLAYAHVLAAASRVALGDERAALHALRNARRTLLVQPLDAPVAGAQGITVGELLLLCDQLQRVLVRTLPGRAS